MPNDQTNLTNQPNAATQGQPPEAGQAQGNQAGSKPTVFKATVRNITNRGVSSADGPAAAAGHNVIVHTRGGGHRELRPGETLTNASFEEGELQSLRRNAREMRGSEKPSLQIIDFWGEDANGNRVELEPLAQKSGDGGTIEPAKGSGGQPTPDGPPGSFTVNSSGSNDDDRARMGEPQKTGQAPVVQAQGEPKAPTNGGVGPGAPVTAQDGGAGQGGTSGGAGNASQGAQPAGQGGAAARSGDTGSAAQRQAGQGDANDGQGTGELAGRTVEQLRATAQAAGIEVKPSWGRDRLQSEIEKAGGKR